MTKKSRSLKPVVGDLRLLADPALLIMVSIAGEAKHGYAIMQDIENLCELRIGPGTLYGALARLDQRGWIKEVATNNYRRRPFRLTDAGTSALLEHLRLVERLAGAGLRRLGSPTLKKGA